MVAHFGLSVSKHIDLLYSNRKCWALTYLKDFFFAGMTTTGRSESINSYVKGFLDTKTNLKDFVNQFGIAVSIRNQAGEEVRMRQKYLNTQELERIVCAIKDMPETQEQSVAFEQQQSDNFGINNALNDDRCNAIENPSKSIAKDRPRGSRAKGGVKVAMKGRYCHVPNCGGTDHDAQIAHLKGELLKFCLLNLQIRCQEVGERLLKFYGFAIFWQ